MQNRINDMDMKAWIPGSSGQGPKFPVPDECRTGVLYLKYKELDIFIPGKALIGTRNNRLEIYENKNKENCNFKNISTHWQTRCDVADSENVVGKIGGGNSELQKFSAVVLSFPNYCDVVDKPCIDVCKNNVSVSDDTRKMIGGGDCRGVSPIDAVLKPEPKRGFVKCLIEYYNSLGATSANK